MVAYVFAGPGGISPRLARSAAMQRKVFHSNLPIPPTAA
jgi:hypothetical protein